MTWGFFGLTSKWRCPKAPADVNLEGLGGPGADGVAGISSKEVASTPSESPAVVLRKGGHQLVTQVPACRMACP